MKKYAILLLMFIIVSAEVAMAERLTVIAPVANIRSAPTTNSDVLWKVEKYHPIFVIHKSGGVVCGGRGN